MYRKLLFGLFLFLVLVSGRNMEDTYACSLADVSRVYIKLERESGNERIYNYDLLIKKSDSISIDQERVSYAYRTAYPDYEDYGYLNDSEWISYTAYVEDAEIDIYKYWVHFPLFVEKGIDEYKIIVFDDNGNVKFISETFSVEDTYGYEDTNWNEAKTHAFTETNLELRFDINDNPCDDIEALNMFFYFFPAILIIGGVIVILGVMYYFKKRSWR